MKTVIIFLALFSTSIAEQSIYSIHYTFDDSEFFIQDIKKPYKEPGISIILKNNRDQYLIIEEDFIENTVCPNIKAMLVFNEYKNKNSDVCNKLFNLIYTKKVFDIVLEKFNVKVYANNDRSVFTAIIFKENVFIGIMHTNISLEQFLIILRTLKNSTKILSSKEYISKAKLHIEKVEINLALKNLISALLIEPGNIEIKKLLQKIYSLQESILLQKKTSISDF